MARCELWYVKVCDQSSQTCQATAYQSSSSSGGDQIMRPLCPSHFLQAGVCLSLQTASRVSARFISSCSQFARRGLRAMLGAGRERSLYLQKRASAARRRRAQWMRCWKTQSDAFTSQRSPNCSPHTFCPIPLTPDTTACLQSRGVPEKALSWQARQKATPTSATTTSRQYSSDSLNTPRHRLRIDIYLYLHRGVLTWLQFKTPARQVLNQNNQGKSGGYLLCEGVGRVAALGLQMFSLNSVLQSLHPSKLVSNLASNYSKLKDRISPPLPITQVIQGLYHCDFPHAHHALQLAQHAPGPLLLINLSEYTYEDELPKLLQQHAPNATLLHLNYELYSTLPLCELMETITKVQGALGKGERVYLHCQEGRVRSAVFLASYLFVGEGVDISEAILRVNKLLGIEMEGAEGYRSQHALFKHLVNYNTDRNCINAHSLRLSRISITHAPRIRSKEGPLVVGEVQVVVEVRCGAAVVHRSVYPQGVRGEDAVCVQLGKGVLVSDQFLLILKYLHRNTLYNVMRIQANTNFIFNCFARVHHHDADLSAHCLPTNTTAFIDLTFTPDPALSRLALLSRPAVVSAPVKDKSWDLLGGEELYGEEERFEWLQEAEIDENELNCKIEQVMQNMHLKEEQRGEDKEDEEGEEEDFDDYLGKLEAQAHH